MTSVEICVLGPGRIEELHAHLLRACAGGAGPRLDANAISSHCLRLIGSQAILIGGYAQGTLRAALEILPDRGGKSAHAVFSAEDGFSDHAVTQMLALRLVDETRSHRLCDVTIEGLSEKAVALIARPNDPAGASPSRIRLAAAA